MFDESIDGWFTREDAQTYDGLASGIEAGWIAEIGVWKGRSLSAIAEGCRHAGNKILAVDTWKGSEEHRHLDCTRLYDQFMEVRKSHQWENFVWPMHMTSVEASRLCGKLNLRFDLVFVDGPHDYESVFSDLVSWIPLLKRPGIIAGHDYSPGGGGSVAEVVNRIFAECHHKIVLPIAGSSVWSAQL